MLHTSTVISYLQECFAGKPVKITDENSSATFYVWNSVPVNNFLFLFTNSAWVNWGLATDLLGGRGIQTSPFLALNPRLPRLFFLASSLESRFSSCSLRNIEYCCVTSPYFPPPQFPTLFRAPTSRPFFSFLSYPSHPLFARAPSPWPIWL